MPTRLAAIPTATIMEMVFRHPRISAALWWSSLQEEAILRERIVALGRRDAAGRLAYLLCELFWRFQAIGATAKGSYEFPLTQDELDDTLGLTPAHVNRVLQRLRRQELIAYGRRTITILAPDELQAVAGFDRRYLIWVAHRGECGTTSTAWNASPGAPEPARALALDPGPLGPGRAELCARPAAPWSMQPVGRTPVSWRRAPRQQAGCHRSRRRHRA